MIETPAQRVARVVREEIVLSPYDPRWPEAFRHENEHLLACVPGAGGMMIVQT